MDTNSTTVQSTIKFESLNDAIVYGKIEDVVAMLEHDTNTQSSLAPLQTAIRHKKTAIVQLLLNSGADPNFVSKGYIPLILAIKENPESVRILLEHGADPNVITPKNEIPLFHAVACQNYEAINLLIQSGSDFQVKTPSGTKHAIHLAVHNGDAKALFIFLQNNCPTNCVDSHGRNLLTISETKESPSCEFLLNMFPKLPKKLYSKEFLDFAHDFAQQNGEIGLKAVQSVAESTSSPERLTYLRKFSLGWHYLARYQLLITETIDQIQKEIEQMKLSIPKTEKEMLEQLETVEILNQISQIWNNQIDKSKEKISEISDPLRDFQEIKSNWSALIQERESDMAEVRQVLSRSVVALEIQSIDEELAEIKKMQKSAETEVEDFRTAALQYAKQIQKSSGSKSAEKIAAMLKSQ